MGPPAGLVLFIILLGLAFAYVEMTRTPDAKPEETKAANSKK